MDEWECETFSQYWVYRHVEFEDPIVYYKNLMVISDIPPYCYRGICFETLEEAIDCAMNELY